MQSLAILALSLVIAAFPVQADVIDDANAQVSQAEQSARTSLLAAERVLYPAKQAIDAAAVIISSIENERLIHAELGRLARGVPGARAIIVLGPDGKLTHDSYRYPAGDLDLSDRVYFKEAIATPGFTVGESVTGKSSGTSFVPLVKRMGQQTIVVVASPFSLLDVQSECADCWNLVLRNDGDIVTMFPPEATVSRSLTEIAASAVANEGSRIVRYHNSVVAVAWRRSEKFPITIMSVRGITDTAAAGIDLN